MSTAAEDAAAQPAVPPTPEPSPPPPPAPPDDGVAAPAFPLAAHHPRRGTTAPKVTIVEVAHFHGSEVGALAPVLNRLRDSYQPADLAVVFVHHPPAGDEDAQRAARAMQAAHHQRKAWEMHDVLAAHPDALSASEISGYATGIGLDASRFAGDLDDASVRAEVSHDADLAERLGVGTAPTFFINCRKLVGAKSFDDFKPVVDAEIARADRLLASGTQLESLYDELCRTAPR